MLHVLMRVFEEEGAQVLSANLQILDDRTAYTIIAQVCMNAARNKYVNIYTAHE